ncbi:MAG: hypothetical protein RRB13_13005 [bacterium]|nr:hypothetical protein [bacterium]
MNTLPHFVLAYHGCDQSIVEKIVNDATSNLEPSKNNYDWLGHGTYFWENDPQRARKYAEDIHKNPRLSSKDPIKNPAVIGAIIDLGNCFNLIEAKHLDFLKGGYEHFKAHTEKLKKPLPTNRSGLRKTTDLLLRELDCAVIESIHEYMKENNKPEFDTVRAVFWEGRDLYPNAGFAEKNHIQICVRDPQMIQGYFLPRF